ncbi:MAG: hypothetical protein WDZ31_12305 [Phycisphaeraceae bacterium]
MNFSTDRDLLVLEPSVFVDVPFAAQQRVRVNDGELEGTTLSSVDADFEVVGVEAGQVVLVDRVAYEVIDRLDATTLTISRPRARLSDPLVPGDTGSEREVLVRTFAPQAALVHDALLRLLGIDPDDDSAGGLTEDAVVSLSVVARLEALGTLERIYSGAAAIGGDNEALLVKAQHYHRRFRESVAQASVLIDIDGDGRADERRHLGLIRLSRV